MENSNKCRNIGEPHQKHTKYDNANEINKNTRNMNKLYQHMVKWQRVSINKWNLFNKSANTY